MDQAKQNPGPSYKCLALAQPTQNRVSPSSGLLYFIIKKNENGLISKLVAHPVRMFVCKVGGVKKVEMV